jgi:hypothetical protein
MKTKSKIKSTVNQKQARGIRVKTRIKAGLMGIWNHNQN